MLNHSLKPLRRHKKNHRPSFLTVMDRGFTERNFLQTKDGNQESQVRCDRLSIRHGGRSEQVDLEGFRDREGWRRPESDNWQ
jgi:hypothetical protein